ncbi:MAG: endonuclease/exonuclease/phosphatase family protein [Candidatus Saccharimonas sp.]|nr:endonuclease/exonuclease/phosphatase family protein [Planctomycetaceae bacterium]
MSSTPSPTSSSSRAVARWVIGLSWFNLAALGVLCWLLFVVSESWWVGTVLTYAPRAPFVAPTLGLLVAALFWHRPALWVNAVSLVVVLSPVMGLSLPASRLLSPSIVESGEFELKVVSCNVQAFKPNFKKVLEEIAVIDPDVVALQEAFPLSPLLDEAFRGWYTVSHDRYWVGSRFPVKLVAQCEVPIFERSAGMVVEIETPSGPVLLGDIHQMTARRGLVELSKRSLFGGEGPRRLEESQELREEESLTIRDQIESARGDKPLLLVGDFNTPVSSQMFQRHWGDFQSAFDLAGIGYGYTSPCKANRYWPENLPWARIDHILCSPEWTVRSCQIGKSAGSDHRLIAATLRLSVPAAVTSDEVVAGVR